MAYRVKSNTTKIITEKDQKMAVAIRFALEDIYKIAYPKTPKKFGPLRDKVTRRMYGKRGMIKWRQKYAAYQERGYTNGRVRRYTTPGTGKNFARNAVRQVRRNFRKYAKRAGL